MPELENRPSSGTTRGCLAAGFGAAVLALLSPFIAAIRGWKSWRRGSEIRISLTVTSVSRDRASDLKRFDFSADVPAPAEPEFRRLMADTVIRVAEALRRPDDVYHLVYRLPWDEESIAVPVGPQIQELGERFSLAQSQNALDARTAVWLCIGRHRALAEVIDPVAFDPESEGEPDGLQRRADVRWSAATARARHGASLVFRLILVLPAEKASRVVGLVGRLVERERG
jgi:hypothetical protein